MIGSERGLGSMVRRCLRRILVEGRLKGEGERRGEGKKGGGGERGRKREG